MSSGTKSGKIRGEFALGLLLFLIVLAVFGPSVFFEFVTWDDDHLITGNPYFGGVTWERLGWMFTNMDYVGRYLPLTWLSWSINYDLGGLDPFGYHLFNVLLHAANAALVFTVIRKMLLWRYPEAGSSERGEWMNVAAAIAAALWAVHPFRAEPVAWITDRVYCQALFFLLLAWWCYLEWRRGDCSNRWLYWLGVLLFGLSVFSYQTGLCYFVVLAVFDFWPLRRFNTGWRSLWDRKAIRIWLEKAPYLVLSLVIASLALWARFYARSKPALTDDFGVVHHIAQACYVWAYYIWKPLVPTDLSPLYTTLISIDPWDFKFVGSAVAIVVMSAVLWRRRAQWPGLLAIWICHLAMLLPVAGLTEQPHYPNDRYNYFASICWCVGVGAMLMHFRVSTRSGFWLRLCGAAAVLVLAISTQKQTRIWTNSEALLEHICSKLGGTPAPAALYLRLANAHAQAGNTNSAVGAFRQFIAASSTEAAHFDEVAQALFHYGMFEESKQFYEAALTARPEDAQLRNDYGVALGAGGKLDNALQQFHEAARLQPDLSGPWQNIALVLTRQGRTNEAEVFHARAREAQASTDHADHH